MTRITKRELHGRELANLTNLAIRGILKSQREKYILKLINVLENHEFQKRKKTDPPHPNSNYKHTLEDVADPTNPEGLAQILIHDMDRYYNADTANAVKKYLLKNLS